jgi:hypothetical protein
MRLLTIVETTVFSRLVTAHVGIEEYRKLQLQLAADPELGRKIPGSGGLRKVRFGIEGRGKRGGVRVIYFWAPEQGTC